MTISKLFLSLVSCFVFSISLLPAAEMAGASLGKIAELGCHRLERLVTLGKIEESFLTKINTLQVTKLDPKTPNEPSFKITVTQYPGADGSAKSVEMMMDKTGKGVSQTIKEGASPLNAPVWSDKDSATLLEDSFHYILESNNPDAKPFLSGLKIVTLKQVKNEQGQTMARVLMSSSDTSKILEINLKEDGTIESTNTINP